MDVDFWAARVNPSTQSARLGNSGTNNLVIQEEGDEVRAWFPCPFCYVEIELPMLCIHLQEEHCFDLKNAVCPICAANLGRDALGHFTVQHVHSIKRRKKSQKSGFWSNVSPNIVRDLRELSSFLGANSVNEPSPDPLLSPFLPLTVCRDSPKCVSPCVADVERKDDRILCFLPAANHRVWMKLKDKTMKKRGSELHSFRSYFCRLYSSSSTGK